MILRPYAGVETPASLRTEFFGSFPGKRGSGAEALFILLALRHD